MSRSLEEKKEYFKKWYNLNKEKCSEKSKLQRKTNPRVLKQEKCSECEKIGIYSKKLCQACYSKMRRKTPEGKLGLKLYNETKGKIARQKYLSNKPPKPPKEKKLCDCGKIVIAKGLCRNCYQNKINNKNYIYKPKEKKVFNFNPIYEKILESVTNGSSIGLACIDANITRTFFYKKASDFQKTEIKCVNKMKYKKDIEFFE